MCPSNIELLAPSQLSLPPSLAVLILLSHLSMSRPPAQLGTASPSSSKYDPSHPNIDVQLCVTMLKALQLLVC